MPTHTAAKRRKNKTKSKRQVRFLMSKGSPLDKASKELLRRELKSGKVRVRG